MMWVINHVDSSGSEFHFLCCSSDAEIFPEALKVHFLYHILMLFPLVENRFRVFQIN